MAFGLPLHNIPVNPMNTHELNLDKSGAVVAPPQRDRPLIREGEPCTIIIPPKIVASITGVWRVEIASGGRCRANYVDGSSEYGIVENPNRDNFFSLVGQIQDAARVSTAATNFSKP